MKSKTDELLAKDSVTGRVSELRQDGKVIVTTNGSFDLFHIGHVRYLQEARSQGDVLIVGLNSDASVKSYKGPARPINPELHRAEMLLSLRSVDYVVIFDEPAPMRFIEWVKPDVHVNGAEYGENCIEADTIERLGARLHLVPRDNAVSSTVLIERILRIHHIEPTGRQGIKNSSRSE